MKKLLLSTAAVALMSTAAVAADLPVYEPAPMVAPTPAATDWSGVYLGLHGGYGWGDLTDDDDEEFDFDDAELEGPVFGGQIGVNWQWNYFVLGAEADASWSGINDEGEFEVGEDDEAEVGYDWLASARLRGGFALDRFFLYGTGGAGFAGIDDAGASDDDEAAFGWVAGGGAEVLLTNNVTAGVEYLHYEFEEAFDDGAGDIDASADVIRGRVNVKFNSLFGG